MIRYYCRHDFLPILDSFCAENPAADAVVPHGHAAYACNEDRYDFHDPYFMTSSLHSLPPTGSYRNSVAFMDHFVGQEDVEFVTRFTIAGNTAINCADLNYFHLHCWCIHPYATGSRVFIFWAKKPLFLAGLDPINVKLCPPCTVVSTTRPAVKETGAFWHRFLLGALEGFKGSKEQVYG